MDRAILRDVSRYWFGDLASADAFPADHAEIWFKQSDATDAEIAQRFGRWLKPAASQDWDLDGLSHTEGAGLVVLLDQFPRNMFRASAEAFAYDERARAIARHFVATRFDDFYLIERTFLLLPFEHSENLADQQEGVRLYAALAAQVPAEQTERYRGFLSFAEKHRDLIARFGRFPHRNAVLGRPSTAEEAAFLAEKGRGF